jgi:hypothetical protein
LTAHDFAAVRLPRLRPLDLEPLAPPDRRLPLPDREAVERPPDLDPDDLPLGPRPLIR